MGQLWVGVGSILVIFTLLDTFFTVLNYNEKGLFVNRLVRWEWVALRSFTRKMSPRWHKRILRQITGVILVTVILAWLSGIIFGFALIYYGAIKIGALTTTQADYENFLGMLYFSIGQFSTVGANGISTTQPWVSILSVTETMFSIVLLSLVITFLVNIYSSIQSLRTFCASFPSRRPQVTSPVDSLASFFPHGDTSSLELHLVEIRSNLNGYFDSLAQDRPGYYFQSGADRFAMPFGVFMAAGTVEGICGGLPQGHPAKSLPELSRLVSSLEGCQEQIYARFRWEPPPKVIPLTSELFQEAMAECERGENENTDPYTIRFYTLCHSMMQMSLSQFETDNEQVYQRYCWWLRFVTQADDFIRRSSIDLDYRPTYVEGDYPFSPPVRSYGWHMAS